MTTPAPSADLSRALIAGERAEYGAAWDDLVPTVGRTVGQIVEATIAATLADLDERTDGHHTFAELYHYRALYHAHAARGWLAAGIDVVKSHRHSDGQVAFAPDLFIVTAHLPTGQVSNHYKTRYWDLFAVPEVPRAPVWDGHTPQVAAARLQADLERPTR